MTRGKWEGMDEDWDEDGRRNGGWVVVREVKADRNRTLVDV